MEQKPNIVWLFSDQHRADVMGAVGHPVVSTPNIDRLASEGLLFEDVFCQAPLCVPSRVSLLTERYVRDHGCTQNDYAASTDLPTMPQALRSAGYRTAALGKMHLFPHHHDVDDGRPLMNKLGFDDVLEVSGKLASGETRSAYIDHLEREGLLETYQEFIAERTQWKGAPKPLWTVDPSPLPPEHYLDTWVGDRAVEWIEGATLSEPFFLWVGFPGPHDPWDAPAEAVARYQGVEVPLDSTRRPDVPAEGPLRTFLSAFLKYSCADTLTEERLREVRRHYFANVTLIDDAVGKVLGALERRGLDERTWVVYGSDHGEMLGTHGLFNKMVFYEPSVRVPQVLRPPGGAQPRRVGGLSQQIDLSATLRALAGAGPIDKSAAASFDEVLRDGPFKPEEVVVSEDFGFAMWRTQRYKIVVYERDVLPVQLFDLEADPEEDHNLIDDPARAGLVGDLMAEYVEPFLATPPLRLGPDFAEWSKG